MQPYATGSVSLGSAEEPYVPDMTHSYRLTEGRLIRYPVKRGRVIGVRGYPSDVRVTQRGLNGVLLGRFNASKAVFAPVLVDHVGEYGKCRPKQSQAGHEPDYSTTI